MILLISGDDSTHEIRLEGGACSIRPVWDGTRAVHAGTEACTPELLESLRWIVTSDERFMMHIGSREPLSDEELRDYFDPVA